MQTSSHMSLVATLAAHHAAGEVAAVRFADNAEVELVDTGERMTVDEFFRRYPAGVLIHWHAVEDRR
jgi:ribosomal protein L18E